MHTTKRETHIERQRGIERGREKCKGKYKNVKKKGVCCVVLVVILWLLLLFWRSDFGLRNVYGFVGCF
jgi:hypothetical protein